MAHDKGLSVKMNELGHFVADRLLGNEPIDPEFNAAFKTLTTYWTAAAKLDKVDGEDRDAKSGGFGNAIRSRIAKDEAKGDSEPGAGDPIPFPAAKSGS